MIDRLEDALDGRPYQRRAAEFIARYRNVLIADQPGLGKTVEILAGVRASHDRPVRILVLCPRVAVKDVWEAEIIDRLDAKRVLALPLRGPGKWRAEVLHDLLAIPPAERDMSVFVIANIEMARIKPERDPETDRVKWLARNAEYPDLFSIVWDAIVVDESQKALICTNRKQEKWSQQYAGMKMLRSDQRIAVSGTPMRGKPEQLWGTLNWLRPKEYPGYWQWVDKYFARSANRYTSYIIGELIRPDELARDLRTIMMRRTKAEVLPELPPIQYAGHHLFPGDTDSPFGVWLEMNDKQQRQYRNMVREGVVTGDDNEILANGVLAENARKMLIASAACEVDGRGVLMPTLDSPAYEWLVGKIEELDGERLVVASKSTRLVNVFAAGLRKQGIACHVLTGEVTSDRKRSAMRADFQSARPSASVFMLNGYAGGVALTLDMADYGVMLDETHDPDYREQIENRIHRTSRIHSVTWWMLRTRDTIQEEIALVSAARGNVSAYLMDGARGVEYARNYYLEKRTKS